MASGSLRAAQVRRSTTVNCLLLACLGLVGNLPLSPDHGLLFALAVGFAVAAATDSHHFSGRVFGCSTAAVLSVWWLQQAESKLGRCAVAARLAMALLVALAAGWLIWSAVLGLLADLWRGHATGDPYGVAFYVLWPATSVAAGAARVA